MRTLAAFGLAAALLGAAASGLRADAAPRPDEASLFGAPEAAPAAVNPTAAASAPASGQSVSLSARGADSDAAGLSPATLGHDDFANGSVVDDPLKIGGVFYQQWFADQPANAGPSAASMSMPLQMDTYLDARPNDRVRAFVDARLVYDPTRDAAGNPTSGSGANFGSTIAGTSAATVTGTANPTLLLDQAWVNFDVDRKVFFTVGKQHVKWGTGHIWNPTDFLTVQKLNPLQPYDLRLGDTMVKAQVPVEGMDGTNLYAIALLDNPVPASSLGQTGGAFRAETLLWGAELGVEAVSRDGLYPVYGMDLSAPLGPVDFYTETALSSGEYYPQYGYRGFSGPGASLSSVYSVGMIGGPVDQTVAGLSWDFAWRENRQATLGAEYFYNELGVDTARLLPVLIYLGQYTPFYMGKNYAAVYLTAEGPDEGKKTNYNLSTIANLSDGSAVTRLDFTWLLLDYLTWDVWATAHYGTVGGELNFALDTPALSNPRIPAVNVAATPLELGMSMRVAY